MRSSARRTGAAHLALAVLALWAIGTPDGLFAEAGSGEETYEWNLPPGVPAPRLPPDAVMTEATVELGRHLFYDMRLSGNGTQSCASCHVQELAFTDGRARGLGSTGEQHARSPMSLVNVAYRDALTWANPTLRTLEKHVLVPMLGIHPVELGMAGHEERIYSTLAADPMYQALFANAFPGAAHHVNREQIVIALAAFQRSIVSFDSPFDRYRFYGDTTALDPSARRGMQLFFSSRTNCGGCHMAHNVPHLGINLDGGSKHSASRDDESEVFLFHNTGLYALDEPFSYPEDNLGLYEHTGILRDIGKFRIPTLRNIAVTAPYMHDGSIATLDEVLDHYIAGGRAPNSQQSEFLVPLELSARDRDDLIAFLHSLTDEKLLADPRWSDPWR
jgi:cytochrome c peroxidase